MTERTRYAVEPDANYGITFWDDPKEAREDARSLFENDDVSRVNIHIVKWTDACERGYEQPEFGVDLLAVYTRESIDAHAAKLAAAEAKREAAFQRKLDRDEAKYNARMEALRAARG